VVAARRGQARRCRSSAIRRDPLAGALLFLLFLHLGFPYDRLAWRLAERLGQVTQTQIRFGELEPRLSLGGPGLEVVGVTATPAAGAPIQIERAFLRPAWSLAWLRGRPALHIDLTGVDLANLPLAAALPQSSLQGQADLRLELVLGGETPEASGRFSARDGSLGLPGLPAPVPFTSFAGELAYGGEPPRARGRDARGSLVSVLAGGSLGAAPASPALRCCWTSRSRRSPLQAPLRPPGSTRPEAGRSCTDGYPGRPEIR
jgi:hypothetical protein